MPTRTVKVPGIAVPVHITPRKKSKNIRIRVIDDKVHVSIPLRAPMVAATAFVIKHRAWINEKLAPSRNLQDYHHASLFDETPIVLQRTVGKNSSRYHNKQLIIRLSDADETEQIAYIEKTIFSYYKKRLKSMIEVDLDELSQKFQLYPELVRYKKVMSRWGSCSSDGVLTFSLFLAQQDRSLRRYVIAHELAHLKHMDHSAQFWELVQSMIPDYKTRRRALKLQPMRVVLRQQS